MTAALKLAHAASNRACLTPKEEWRRLALAALAEHDALRWRVAELERKLNSIGPKFQGMTELA